MDLPTVLDCLPDAVWVLDADGRVALDNAAGRNLRVLDAPGGGGGPDGGMFRQCVERLRAGADVPSARFAVETGGGLRWFCAQGWRCGCGGFLIVWRDVSWAKDAEDRLSLFRRALDDSDNAVCIADYRKRDMPLVYVNPSFERLTGYKASEAIGRNCRFLQRGERDVDAIREIRRALGQGRSCRVVVRNFRKDGSMFWNDLFLSPVRDETGRVSHFLGFQNDVTQMREAEEALIEARDSAESADRAKSEFLAVMSHEIRTPMQSVFGFTELLLNTPLDHEQRRYVGVIRSQSDALLGILNDILDFSRLQSGSVQLESIPFEIRSVVGDVMATVQEAAEAKGLVLETQFESALPPLVVGDAARLRQVLVNLVSNAVKFTDRGRVVVRVSTLAPGDGLPTRFGFEVIDTGRGIAEEQMSRLFLSFSQLEAADVRRHGGTGLGLAITKRLCTLMGGEVGVRSCPGKGSTFWARLPFGVVPAGASPGRREEARPQEAVDTGLARKFPLRVLVVEDSPLAAEVARSYLAWMGYGSEHAPNASAALGLVGRRDYDVILMDIQMPDVDGIEGSRVIRAAYGDRIRPQIIAVTANAAAAERERCLAGGLDDYLTKPMTPVQLQGALLRAWARLRGGQGETAPAVQAACVSGTGAAPSLDPAPLRELDAVGGSRAGAARRMIEIMRRDGPESIRVMLSAVDARDWSGLGRAAHRFKGGCSVIGARRLESLCCRILDGVSAGDTESVVTAARSLESEWTALDCELAGHFGGTATVPDRAAS